MLMFKNVKIILLEDFGDLRFDKILNKFELKDEPKAGHDTHAPAGNQAITIGKA